MIVSLEQAVSAPYATRQLADLGARVIKVERTGEGDFARGYDSAVCGSSSYFVWLNRSKESIQLDLKQAGGREILTKLLDRADVFVQNLVPGAADRLGVGAATIRERYARMIVCDIDGYGEGGPYSGRPAYDLLMQCEAGLLSVTGTEEAPAKVGISIADIAAGMQAYVGILLALHRRLLTGQGAHVKVSMLEAMGEWMSQPAYFARYGGTRPRRTGSQHSTIAPYGPFRCGDGATIFVAVQNDREWARLCRDVLSRTDLVTDRRFVGNELRVRHREELEAVLAGWFRQRDVMAAAELLERAQIACARMRDVGDLWGHPQLVARQRLRDIDTPNGRVAAFLPPANVDGLDYRMGPVPAFGANTDALLAELGYDSRAIKRLKSDSVI